MCGTPTRHGAYAVPSYPCNYSVTSSLAIEAPRRTCYPGPPCVVCVTVVGELEIRINPGNLDARRAKRSFHIRTINSRVRARYVLCRRRLRTAEYSCACPGSAARCINGSDAGALVRIDGAVAGSACLSDRSVRVVRTCKAGGCMEIAKAARCNPPRFQTSVWSVASPTTTATYLVLRISLPACRAHATERGGPGRASLDRGIR